MEQKDYILREIEKTGAIIMAIRHKLLTGKDNLPVTPEKQMNNLKRTLLDEAGFDLDMFLQLSQDETVKYIAKFKGFNTKNIELLAQTISELPINKNPHKWHNYLDKALFLYNICNERDKTFSFKRESQIKKIKQAL